MTSIAEHLGYDTGLANKHCECDACKGGNLHASDCAVHNEPAERNGPCSCDQSTLTHFADDATLARIAELERQLAAEKERADYAWRNTNTIEKARQKLERESVTRIMIGITPGEDGMGEEVYAKTVEDVEREMSRLAEKIDAAESARAKSASREAALVEAPTLNAAYAMGATGSKGSEAERMAFEEWMRGHCWPLCAVWEGGSYRGTAEHGEYICPHAMATRRLWAAWRDRAALAKIKEAA